MKLIVGLGNIGDRFDDTRHNIGFSFIDFFCSFMKIKLSDFRQGFDGIFLKTNNFILFKPYTFVNLSGTAIKKIVDFYKINIDDVLIIYDDIYLSFGKIRLREKGESGGHNGIKNIISNLKTTKFKRIKIGVEYIKDKDGNLSDFVLKKFNGTEKEKIKKVFEILSKIVYAYIEKDFDHALNTMNKLNHDML